VEAIRALMVARRSAAGERTRTTGQARALVLTGPGDLRARFGRHTPAALITGPASLRPRSGDVAGYAVRVALRELGRRAQFLDGQPGRLDELIVPLVTARAPGLLALYGLGPRTAALLLIAAGDHPGRLRSEAAWAHLCGAAPIPASSGKVTRHRHGPGGDRQGRAGAVWRIVFTRLGSDAATRAYAGRRTAEGKSKAEIIRCLKRYVARGFFLGKNADPPGPVGEPLEHLRTPRSPLEPLEHLRTPRSPLNPLWLRLFLRVCAVLPDALTPSARPGPGCRLAHRTGTAGRHAAQAAACRGRAWLRKRNLVCRRRRSDRGRTALRWCGCTPPI
jgi:Transposase IS116/IS110/IS902 family